MELAEAKVKARRREKCLRTELSTCLNTECEKCDGYNPSLSCNDMDEADMLAALIKALDELSDTYKKAIDDFINKLHEWMIESETGRIPYREIKEMAKELQNGEKDS